MYWGRFYYEQYNEPQQNIGNLLMLLYWGVFRGSLSDIISTCGSNEGLSRMLLPPCSDTGLSLRDLPLLPQLRWEARVKDTPPPAPTACKKCSCAQCAELWRFRMLQYTVVYDSWYIMKVWGRKGVWSTKALCDLQAFGPKSQPAWT